MAKPSYNSRTVLVPNPKARLFVRPVAIDTTHLIPLTTIPLTFPGFSLRFCRGEVKGMGGRGMKCIARKKNPLWISFCC